MTKNQDKNMSLKNKKVISKSKTLIDEYLSKCGTEIGLPQRLSTIREFGKRKKLVKKKISTPSPLPCPLSPDPLRFEKKKKIKALEEIGMFSEFTNSKKVFDWHHLEHTEKQGTIHVTDFMRKNDKMKLFRLAGDWQSYEIRKNKCKLGLLSQEIAAKCLLTHSELPHMQYSSPQLSPRFIKNKSLFCKKEKPSKTSRSEKSIKLDHIIEKCEQLWITHE